jgi:hypothetical protein
VNPNHEQDRGPSRATLDRAGRVQATWAVGLVGGDWELGEIAPHLAGSVRITRAEDGWEWTSEAFDRLTDAEAVRVFAEETIGLLNGLAAISLQEPGNIQVGNVRRYRPDGAKDVWVFPEPISLRLRVGTPTVLINGVELQARSWIPDLELAADDPKVQAVLAFLGGNVTWHSTYAALDTILDDERTAGRRGVREWAGVSERRLTLFARTANSYGAIGSAARHGPGFLPPERPLTLSDARDLVSEVARKWLDQLRSVAKHGSTEGDAAR